MSVFRTTIFFGQATDGASETYWTSDQSARQAASNIQSLLNNRANLLNTNQYFQGARVSIEGQKRSSQLILPPGAEFFFDSGVGISCPATGTFSPLDINGQADQFRATLQQKFKFGPNRSANRYLSGIPDAISVTEPATFTRNNAIQWWSNLDKFRAFLTNGGWQIKAQVLPPATAAYGIAAVISQSVAPFLLGVTALVGDPAPNIPIGQRIVLQGFRPAKGTRAWTLNGTWYVDSTQFVSTGYLNVWLRGSAGLVAADQRFTDKSLMRIVSYSFYPITDIGTQRVGIHKRGKPSLAPRGRRLTRGSLDP